MEALRKFLRDITQKLEGIDRPEELQTVYERLLRKVAPLEGCALLSYSPSQSSYHIVDARPEPLQEILKHQLEEGLFHWAYESRQVEVVELSLAGTEDRRLALLIPFSANGHAGGIFELIPRPTRKGINSLQQLKAELLSILVSQRLYQLYLQKELEEANRKVERYQAHLEQVDKMVALGELAGSIAHEINNPMTTILGRLQLLLEFGKLDEPVKAKLRKIETEARRISQLVRGLLSFARKQAADSQESEVQVNSLIMQTIELVQHSFRIRNQSIQLKLAEGLPLIRQNPVQLQQVFLNLMNNARQAMGPGGTLTIASGMEDGTLWISFRDTGPGMPKHIQERIFEPFFTTRARSGGTGLGLSICKKLVEHMGGRIEVESQEGKGSEFRILLPVQNE
jgi:signal transduction histidine kinase